MSVKKKVPVHGYCSYIEREPTAYATITKVNFVGSGIDFAKCVGFSCDFQSVCGASENECPLIRIANNIQRW